MIHTHRLEYPRLHRMLQCGCPFKEEMARKARHHIVATAKEELYGQTEDLFTDAQLLRSICVGMERFLTSFRTRAVFKQQLKEKLISWVRAIELAYHLDPCSDINEWPDFVEKDVGIELVKLLHARQPGITKTELKNALGVSKKSVGNYLRKLDPTLRESSDMPDLAPLRIAGHEMHVGIHSETVQNRGDRSYYTPNTLHPLVMQLNVTQTASLLMALQSAYDCGEYGTYCSDVALDIWCQLSAYCKERIRSVFTQNNPAFEVFLDMLDQDMEEGRYPVFKTELTMAEGASTADKLLHAFKAGHACTITLNIDGVITTYQKIQIFKNKNGAYVCYPKNPKTGEESSVAFRLCDVRRIVL